MTDGPASRSAGKPVPAPGLTLIGAFLCASLAMAGATALFEGMTSGNFGWVRHFGAVSFAARPVAFTAVTFMYLAATLVTARGAFVLVSRLGHRR